MESHSQDKGGDMIPKQCRIAASNGGHMDTLGKNGSTKASILRESLQHTREEQRIWELLMQELGDVLCNNKLSLGHPPAGRRVRCIERVAGAASSFVSSFR